LTRLAAEIGKGLAPAREARAIPPGERIHVLGAAGAGASAVVLLAHRAGALVDGCDPGGASPYTQALTDAGIELAWEHSAEHVLRSGDTGSQPRRLSVTKALTAIAPDHPELSAAHELGIPTEPWQQLIADAAATTGQRLVGVAGTHGKSTTTGWLIDLLVRAERDPSAFVGALLRPELTGGTPSTARWGRGPEFVVEADEYAGNFDPYRPSVMVLLNAEWDHPDVFADEDAVLDSFEAWIRRAPGDATLVANTLDAGVNKIVERLQRDWSGTIVAADDEPASYQIGLPGPANASNAMAIVATARVLGIDESVVRESLSSFGGVGRRLELKGEVGSVVVLDDYGHHPTAIARTLEAVRGQYPGRPVWAVYEPLTYHRTASMLDRFAQVLAGADHVAIADIWAGRDPDTTITSAQALADAVGALRGGREPASAPGSVEQTADYLAANVQPGDVVLVMGGGRSYVIAARLVDLLRGARGETPA
jgi:UDP-N-acetylmuramate--alanine ligase